MDTDSVYTGLQKPSQDVYETVIRRAEREPGGEQTKNFCPTDCDSEHTVNTPEREHTRGEQTRQSRSRSCVSISLGVTVCVLLVTVIALGTVLWKQNSSDWERKLEKKKEELEGNQNKSETNWSEAERYRSDAERYRSDAERYRSEAERYKSESERHRIEADRYRKQLETFCLEPSTGKRKQQCCPEGWKEGDSGRCYYVSTDQRSWVSANQFCWSVGAELLVINDKKELEFLGSLVKDNSYYWIGLSWKAWESQWRWVDGTVLDKEVVTAGTGYSGYCGYWNPGWKTVNPQKCESPLRWICEGDAVRVWPPSSLS
ncbi:C-type lectin domain family 12 member B-like isoform X2 [Lepisosteus oculatus]|uniref:C-type lectin domain family 12 member B-like isoform X2 n=2 Tax=Lepisosteus oculatus TaxID=7918 RepID=UPI0035F52C1E